MTAGTATTAERTRSCAADLLKHGIDVRAMADEALRALIARERDYFQLMLGAGEPSDGQIFRLLRRDAGPAAQPARSQVLVRRPGAGGRRRRGGRLQG